MDTCFDALSRADVDGNLLLTQGEYVQAVRSLVSGGGADDLGEFFEFPAELSGAFSSRAPTVAADGIQRVVPIIAFGADDGAAAGSISFTDATRDEVVAEENFCRDIYVGLSVALGVEPVSMLDCKIALTSGDRNRDNALSEQEYSYFLNNLSGGIVPASTPFESLSVAVQTVFNNFKDPTMGSVNVFGSKPGQASLVSQQQELFLSDFCQQSALAVQIADNKRPSPAPTPATTQLEDCIASISASDANQDSLLAQNEYLTFLNILTNDKYAGVQQFASLPQVLQLNYMNLVAPGNTEIGIAGSGANQVPTIEEKQHLKDICEFTDLAIQTAAADEIGVSMPSSRPTQRPVPSIPPATSPTTTLPPFPGPVLTAPPSPAASTAPTIAPDRPATGADSSIPFKKCASLLYASDINNDNYLNQNEYTTFVNLLASPIWFGQEFETLPQLLQDHFTSEISADDGRIEIDGSNPIDQPATSEQEAALKAFCESTVITIERVVEEGGGSDISTKPPPTASVRSAIYNAYSISNEVGLTAADLQSGPNRQAINDGYDAFVVDQFGDFLSDTQSRRMESVLLRRRYSATDRRRVLHPHSQSSVQLLSDQTETYLVVDSECPDGFAGDCQMVYGKFLIETTNIADSDSLVKALGTKVQLSITDELQPYIVSAFPDVQVSVEKASPLDEVEPPPTQPPSQSTEQLPEGASAGYIAGSVISILFAIIVLAGISWWIWKGEDFSCPLGISCCWPVSQTTKLDDNQEPKRRSSKKAVEDLEKSNTSNGKSEEIAEPVKQAGEEKEDLTEVGNKSWSAKNYFAQFEEMFSPNRGKRAEVSFFGKEGEMPELSTSSAQDSVGPISLPDVSGRSDVSSSTLDFPEYEYRSEEYQSDDLMLPPNILLGPVAHTSASNVDYGYNEDIVLPPLQQSSGSSEGPETSTEAVNEQESPFDNQPAWGQAGPASYTSRSSSQSTPLSYAESSTSEGTPQREPAYERQIQSLVHEVVPESEDNIGPIMQHFAGREEVLIETLAAMQRSSVQHDATADDVQSCTAEEENVPSSQPSSSFPPSDLERDNSQSFAPPSPEHRSSVATTASEAEIRRRQRLRELVEKLLEEVAPEQLENVDEMMDRFAGRESELLNALQMMRQRSPSRRARKGVHKSKTVQKKQRSGSPKGASPSYGAEIASASTFETRNHQSDEEKVEEREEGDSDDESSSYDENYREESSSEDDDEGAGEDPDTLSPSAGGDSGGPSFSCSHSGTGHSFYDGSDGNDEEDGQTGGTERGGGGGAGHRTGAAGRSARRDDVADAAAGTRSRTVDRDSRRRRDDADVTAGATSSPPQPSRRRNRTRRRNK